MSALNVAYLAGVIDARGHVEVNVRHDRPQPRIRITTRRFGLLSHLAECTGTKVYADDRGYERRPCSNHCHEPHVHVVRQSSRWTVDSSRATIVLYNIEPFIVDKRDEVRTALMAGLDAFPPTRSNVPEVMVRLGWAIPSVEEVAAWLTPASPLTSSAAAG